MRYSAQDPDRRPARTGLVAHNRRHRTHYVGLRSDHARGHHQRRREIKVYATANGRAFPVKVAHDPPGSIMTWSGRMPLGLFRGVRTFPLADEGGSVTEDFTGPPVKVMARSMPDLQPNFDQYVAGVRSKPED